MTHSRMITNRKRDRRTCFAVKLGGGTIHMHLLFKHIHSTPCCQLETDAPDRHTTRRTMYAFACNSDLQKSRCVLRETNRLLRLHTLKWAMANGRTTEHQRFFSICWNNIWFIQRKSTNSGHKQRNREVDKLEEQNMQHTLALNKTKFLRLMTTRDLRSPILTSSRRNVLAVGQLSPRLSHHHLKQITI